MKNFSFFFCMLFTSPYLIAQKDTLRKYLDNKLAFTTKANMTYPAIRIKEGGRWLLFAVYPDTSVLLRIYFLNPALTIKDGPFTIFHPKRISMIKGHFINNKSNGIWNYRYATGQLRDSGLIEDNKLSGTWHFWHENGQIGAIENYVTVDPKEKNFPMIKLGKSNSNKFPASFDLIKYLHGSSQSFHENGNRKDSGTYHYNKRDGLWKYWYANDQLESIGTIREDTLHGKWQFFREDGTTSTKETYARNKLLDLECYNEKGTYTGQNCSVMKPAIPEGIFNLSEYALDHIYWPKELKNKSVIGIVKVSYTVSVEGKLISCEILQSPHALLSKEVQRFFSTLTIWSPAISHNRIIRYTGELNIPFLK